MNCCQQRIQASFLETDELDLIQKANIVKFFTSLCGLLNKWPKITWLTISARHSQPDNTHTHTHTDAHTQSDTVTKCVSRHVMCNILDPQWGGRAAKRSWGVAADSTHAERGRLCVGGQDVQVKHLKTSLLLSRKESCRCSLEGRSVVCTLCFPFLFVVLFLKRNYSLSVRDEQSVY